MYTIRDETTGTESRTNLTKKSRPAKRQNEWLRSSIPPSASSFHIPSNPFPFISFFLSLFFFLLTHQHRYCSTLLCPCFPCAVVEISPSNPWRKKKRKVVHNSIMSTQHIEPAGKKVEEKRERPHLNMFPPPCRLFYHFSLNSAQLNVPPAHRRRLLTLI